MDTKYIEAEKELAELLGYTSIEIEDGCLFAWKDGTSVICPRWCRESENAFELMCEYDCYPVDWQGNILWRV